MSDLLNNQMLGQSANHFLAMLNGEIVEQQVYALKKLNQIVDYQWHEISDMLPKMEQLVEEMNTLSVSLTSTFETLPFSPKKD